MNAAFAVGDKVRTVTGKRSLWTVVSSFTNPQTGNVHYQLLHAAENALHSCRASAITAA